MWWVQYAEFEKCNQQDASTPNTNAFDKNPNCVTITQPKPISKTVVTQAPESTPKKPASRKETAEQTRQKILETAMDIIGDQGYAALTTNKLVKQAGIAKGTLYHHFENVEAVMICLLESFVDTCMESVPIDAHDTLLRAALVTYTPLAILPSTWSTATTKCSTLSWDLCRCR